ncbi:3-oxoacyl-[acyl-carrier-protein] synthase [Linderina macrospora]|uniref:3-oxoacyl-[acyl-carrier-protein] synthase n=1 Tax=Linderina macrospora TaxID=4868 RepID=A0ACC1J5J7_9FUNG|nr:3-oxoacyl-[acyl-carrier-protein] synthase [Linderina macrospora]
MSTDDLARKYLLKQEAQTQALHLLPSTGVGIGVDIEMLADINIDSETFIERNFTEREIAYCQKQPDARASFTGRWCAKEAVIKAVSNLHLQREKVWVRGSAAPVVDIEIVIAESGAPEVVLHGEVEEAAKKAGVAQVKVSISHIDTYAIATAIAF